MLALSVAGSEAFAWLLVVLAVLAGVWLLLSLIRGWPGPRP